MTSSASSPISLAIAGYVAGRVTPERLVAQVAAAYYDGGEAGEGGTRKDSLAVGGKREELRPLIEVIDRASPGIAELGSVESGPGFDIRLAERPCPKQDESEPRRARESCLVRERSGEEAGEGGTLKDSLTVGEKGVLLSRVLGVIRRLFSASARSRPAPAAPLPRRSPPRAARTREVP